jgi:hypothetical protein
LRRPRRSARRCRRAGGGIPLSAGLSSVSATTVDLSVPVLNIVPAGAAITFTPPYPSDLKALVQYWLAFPTAVSGVPSTQTYQSSDDETQFWPDAAAKHAEGFLGLVLCAVTDGFIIPPPDGVALGDKIRDTLLPAKTVTALAAVTAQQWTDFFTKHPTWLPPGTGNIAARIAAFIRQLQAFLTVDGGGPSASFVVATTAATAVGATDLHFAPTPKIMPGMSVGGSSGIVAGTTVAVGGVTTTAAETTVTLNHAVTSPGVAVDTPITFSMSTSAGAGSPYPTLPALAKDKLADCLSAYGAFTLGSGFDPTKLRVAALSVFPGDAVAQEWIVDALVTLDALYAVIKPVAIPTPALAFSVIEALYARGFTAAALMTQLTGDQFAQALAGTVAQQFADQIYQSAKAIAPPQPAPPPGKGFAPVNPDGSLTNCVPSACASPLGPVAYLAELLALSALSTCTSPVAAPLTLPTSADINTTTMTLPFAFTGGVIRGMSVSGTNIDAGTSVTGVDATSVTISKLVTNVPKGTNVTFTAPNLASLLSGRRGPIGKLTASCANLETPLPLIDIVNECLEYMGAQASPTCGTVYDTSADALAGHLLCQDEPCPDDNARRCHEPARIFAALPEFSTPATPVKEDSAVEPAVYDTLEKDFSSCRLPYSQALDVSRTYLRLFRSCRFDAMRTFRKCITEFVLSPAVEPTGFEDWLWRCPVRIDIAIEYLGLTPEEYAFLFHGTPGPRCGPLIDRQPPGDRQGSGDGPAAWQLYGFASAQDNWITTVSQLPEFLARTCLTYCEFYELWQAKFVQFGGIDRDSDNRDVGDFSQCEPCCLDRFTLAFPAQERGGQEIGLLQLAIFIRLWRKLRDGCCFCYSFAELRDICDVLHLFDGTGQNPKAGAALNGEFIRQLAAFQMLRDQFRLDLVDPRDPPAGSAVDDKRTQLLALWVGPTSPKWGWAVRQLCEKIVLQARRRHGCEHRSEEFAEALNARLDALSILAGFDPASTSDNWHAHPTHTLRFAEILAKLTASRFTIAEVLYLFSVDNQADGDRVFPLQEESEAIEHPLGLPDDEGRFSLWRLRRKLLEAREFPLAREIDERVSVTVEETVSERAESDRDEFDEDDRHDDRRRDDRRRDDRREDGRREDGRPQDHWRQDDRRQDDERDDDGDDHDRREDDERHEEVDIEAPISEERRDEWDWRRVAGVLQDELGFAASDILDLGRHFFPHVLEKAGYQVDSGPARFSSGLHAANTTPGMWNAPGEGPFQYDTATEQLWIRIPLSDRAVIAQLTRLQSLNTDEQTTVQDLYFQPRAALALFAVLFPDFPAAQWHLIEEPEASERWEYFRRRVAHCHHRCHIIAQHIAAHVEAVTRQKCPDGKAVALLILRQMFGDENKATADWEADDGSVPAVTWTPPPNGGAFGALLGLVGTGLIAEYKVAGGGPVWRDVSGSLAGFDHMRDRENAPVPTVLPSLAATIGPPLSNYVTVRNGFLAKNAGGARVGGAQGFDVTLTGALLVDEEGHYEFWAGAPAAGDERSEGRPEDHSKWRVTLKRGSRTFVLLTHDWPGEEERRSAARHLRRGAYDLTVELTRPSPDFASNDQVRPLHTGLEVKYSGPDTGRERTAIPTSQLFSVLKEQPLLGNDLNPPGAGATSFLSRYYTSSFRDIRRTYQRAFKALLFAHRLALSARRDGQGTSELGYMLSEQEKFAGSSFYNKTGTYTRHAADFNFNFLPIADDYHSPAADARAHPQAKRRQALFDWWERVFDYTVARDDIRRRRDRQMWHLFAQARATTPGDPAPLLGQIGTDPRFWHLELRYYQAQNAPTYPVTSSDLEDDRFGVRVWHADRWLAALDCNFAAKDITTARPDLWAADDPSRPVGSGETGNANLSAFVCDGCLENGEPRRYEELKRVNDGLRERGRDALLAFLCRLNRVPLPFSPGQHATVPRDLSDLLLLDVETGICQRASRIDEAITAVQSIVRRARLHLEPNLIVTPGFVEMWDREFATFHVWQACKRRHLYKENWIEWADLEKARKVEAFRFLENNLKRSTLSIAVPGGAQWWPDQRPPTRREPPRLQQREPAAMQLLSTPREGLDLIGTPERDARPAWLTAVDAGGGSGGRQGPASAGAKALPYWLEAAVRIGTLFCRVAAAGQPPSALLFAPHAQDAAEDCVTCCEECGCRHPDLVDEYYFWLVPCEIAGARRGRRGSGRLCVGQRLSERLSGRLLRSRPAAVGRLAGSQSAAPVAGVAADAGGPPRLVPHPQRRVPGAAALAARAPGGSDECRRPRLHGEDRGFTDVFDQQRDFAARVRGSLAGRLPL